MTTRPGSNGRPDRTTSELREPDQPRARERDLETRNLPESRGSPGAQDALRRIEDFAATLSGWFWETDADHRFVYLSPNVESISALPAEWHYGKTRQDIGCPESISMAEWNSYLETIAARQPISNFVYRRQGPDGDTWLRVSGNPVFDDAGAFAGYRGTAADISDEIRQRDRAIRLSNAIEGKNRILETTLRTIPDGVQVMDEDLKMVAWNDQLFDVMDLDKTAILAADDPGMAFFRGLAQRGEYGDGDVDALVRKRLNIARSAKPIHFERQLMTGRWIECRGTPIDGGSYLSVYRDVTATRKMIDRLEQQASVDPLTGALNRRKFMEIAQEEFDRARRYNRPLAFAVLDIDHFKAVNDTHGHAAGDAALKRVVATCRDGFRFSDRVGRFGGEEFVLLLPETDCEGAVAVAERLRRTISEMSVECDGTEFNITTSAGASAAGEMHNGPEDVIADADAALYEAKDSGRNRVMCRSAPCGECETGSVAAR